MKKTINIIGRKLTNFTYYQKGEMNMSYKLVQNLTEVNYTKGNSGRKYIVLHYTGNKTDTATNNANYFKSVNRGASAHYFVDENQVVQVVDENDTAWSVGKNYGSNNLFGKCTNANSISVEMCSTNGKIADATFKNAVALMKDIMARYNITAENVVRHWDVCSKVCPGWDGWGANGKDDSIWEKFKKEIGGEVTESEITANPTTPSSSSYNGNSIVDYLNSLGIDSSFENRSKLAEQYGISNYSGTAEQNLQLLYAMRSKKEDDAVSNTTSSYTGNSIVDYLNSIGMDSSFSNRQKLATQYGISNYTGTAEQNLSLLNKMRGGSTPTTSTTSYYEAFTSTSIVDGLKSIGVDSSFENRNKIAQANGIDNYTGTESQNVQLLSLAKQGELKK